MLSLEILQCQLRARDPMNAAATAEVAHLIETLQAILRLLGQKCVEGFLKHVILILI